MDICAIVCGNLLKTFSVISLSWHAFFATVCACFVVACRIVILRMSAISCTTSEIKIDPLSVMITLGKYACLVMTSMLYFAALTIVGLIPGMQLRILRLHQLL